MTLTPDVRKNIYGFLAAAAGILVTTQTITGTQATGWLGVADALLSVAALALAAYHAKRLDFTLLYGGVAALLAALAGVNVLTPGGLNLSTQILQGCMAAVPLLLAFVRTDATTTTGAPASESAPQ